VLYQKRVYSVLIMGVIAFVLLPWYRIEGGFFGFSWVSSFFGQSDLQPGLMQVLLQGRWWIVLVFLCLVLGFPVMLFKPVEKTACLILALGIAGLLILTLQSFAIGYVGWSYDFLENMFGSLAQGQLALGTGAIVLALVFVYMIAFGAAGMGALKGDSFVVSAIAILMLLIIVFTVYPLLAMFISAFQDITGAFVPERFSENMFHEGIWSLKCLGQGERCGVAWQTLFLALMTALASTILGLFCALIATRSNFMFKKQLRLLTILPIITPPFVIGLALLLLFGRSGIVSSFFQYAFNIELGRWLYGFWGIWIAQILSFTPIAFLVLVGVVEGISPSLEEASQTLKADRWGTFRKVTLPLMAPGLANAFLLNFIESMADFGNPLVLGGSYNVLSTDIFYAVVGAQNDPARAAVLSIVLLLFALGVFLLQRLWLAGKNYTTVTGKGDSGIHAALPGRVYWLCCAIVVPWVSFTIILYGMIIYGGFVEVWGLDHSFTLSHYWRAFAVTFNDGSLVWSGAAWKSFWTTMEISLISAPLTAAVGLLAAWLIVRQKFWGKNAFEFCLMLSFAIPGTVIGVSYIAAFNMTPLEMTGSALILVACFVFRNMPVGVRGGIAAMSQLDKSLDEASLTLRANSARTAFKVVLPLLKPAITSALVYSFVRAVTSISAVIFLVSAQHNMATAYIVGMVEYGDYGMAIAYSSSLIFVMVGVIVVFQLLVGKRKLRRENRVSTPPNVVATPI